MSYGTMKEEKEAAKKNSLAELAESESSSLVVSAFSLGKSVCFISEGCARDALKRFKRFFATCRSKAETTEVYPGFHRSVHADWHG